MSDSQSTITFVDTNILVYAHDQDEGAKHRQAVELVTRLWEQRSGAISTQVLQEFYQTITRKIPKPISPSRARGIIQAYGQWQLETNELATILQASEIQERHRLSFWDAMIVAAAVRAGAEVLVTEDLNAGQFVEGVLIRNPFVS
jgi:predicted nucleic acid-binding protein